MKNKMNKANWKFESKRRKEKEVDRILMNAKREEAKIKIKMKEEKQLKKKQKKRKIEQTPARRKDWKPPFQAGGLDHQRPNT